MKKGWIEILFNIVFWILTTWMFTVSFSIQSQEIEMMNGVETVRIVRNNNIIIQLLWCIGIALIMFYGNLWNILKLKLGLRKEWVAARSFCILLVALTLYFVLYRAGAISGALPLPETIWIGIFVFYFIISVAYGFARIWIHTEGLRKTLAFEKKNAELNLLRNQLQPHFLFNILNNLLSLIDQQKDPLLAKSIEKLSGLLRYVVYDTQAGIVSIKKEINFIRNYVALQLLRFEDGEVNFSLDIMGKFDNQLVEPGLFIPFIENAFKYGAGPEVNATIKISFNLLEETFIGFSITNTILPVQRQKQDMGIGIKTTKKRLQLIYPHKHNLKISEAKLYTVDLKIESDAGNNY